MSTRTFNSNRKPGCHARSETAAAFASPATSAAVREPLTANLTANSGMASCLRNEWQVVSQRLQLIDQARARFEFRKE